MPRLAKRHLIPILLLLLLAVGLLSYRILHRAPAETPGMTAGTEALPKREVILYFGSSDGFSLVAEARELPDGGNAQLAKAAVEALVGGPRTELTPILPAGARLLGYAEQDGVATLDFSRDLVAAHPGGSMSELLTVYGLVDTLAVNLPHIRKVRFLVEGRPIETLKGHVDLRRPLAADFRFARPSAGDAASHEQEN